VPPTAPAGWLIVGVGRHADQYGLPGLAQASTGSAVALCGSDPGRAAQLAGRHGVPHWGTSLPAALADPAVTHVYICSRNDDHQRQVTQAASAGKHVLCEKPLAATIGDAQRMVEHCRQAGVALGTGFHLRHNVANARVRELVTTGVIGDPLWIEVTYVHELGHGDSAARLAVSRSLTGPSKGAMAGTGAHAVDLVRWILDDDIDSLTASVAERDAPSPSGGQRIVHLAGLTARGTLVTVAAGRTRHPGNRIAVRGCRGTVTATGSIGNQGGGTVHVVTDVAGEVLTFPSRDVYRDQFDAFVSATTAGQAVSASGRDGVAAMAVVAAVDRSLLTASPTRVADPADRLPEGVS
jgi:1,5-anhydro-D-fructose reductase (1,5-anhydro-D-mannitol-forming)